MPATTIVVLTATGRTATIVSNERPGPPIVALTHSIEVARRLAPWYGVTPLVVDHQLSLDHVEEIEQRVIDHGFAAPGDHIVILGSTPRGSRRASVTLQILKLSTPSRTERPGGDDQAVRDADT